MKLTARIGRFLDRLVDKIFPPGPPPPTTTHTVDFTGVIDGAEFKNASWDVYEGHCVAVGMHRDVTFLGGAVVAGNYHCQWWKNGEFAGDKLTLHSWEGGTFKGKHLVGGHWDSDGECVAESVHLSAWHKGVCKAKFAEIRDWLNGEFAGETLSVENVWYDGTFSGGTLSVGKWKGGTFKGDTFHGKWYGGVWKGKHFKGIDLSGSGLEFDHETHEIH